MFYISNCISYIYIHTPTNQSDSTDRISCAVQAHTLIYRELCDQLAVPYCNGVGRPSDSELRKREFAQSIAVLMTTNYSASSRYYVCTRGEQQQQRITAVQQAIQLFFDDKPSEKITLQQHQKSTTTNVVGRSTAAASSNDNK